jgi:hypothetical protein
MEECQSRNLTLLLTKCIILPSNWINGYADGCESSPLGQQVGPPFVWAIDVESDGGGCRSGLPWCGSGCGYAFSPQAPPPTQRYAADLCQAGKKHGLSIHGQGNFVSHCAYFPDWDDLIDFEAPLADCRINCRAPAAPDAGIASAGYVTDALDNRFAVMEDGGG